MLARCEDIAYTAQQKRKKVQPLWNSFMGPQKVKQNFHTPSTAKYMPTRTETSIKRKERKLAHKEPKVRNIRPSTDEQKNKTIFSSSGILFSHKKK